MSVFIVAEIGGNHNGSLGKAKQLVCAAADAGADAIKLQTFTPETLTMDGPDEYFKIKSGPWAGWNLIDLYRTTMTPREWHQPLFELAHSLGMVPFSSPFCPGDVDFLETLECPIYKIASFEIGDHELLKRVARTGKRVFISTGVASTTEISQALHVFKTHSPTMMDVTLLHCISEYPAEPSRMNMGQLSKLKYHICSSVGLSDHSMNMTACIMAVAMGATVIEKHLCLSRDDDGPDSHFSLEPEEFAMTVRAIREAEKAMIPSVVQSSHKGMRKSLWITQDVKAGDVLTPDNVKILRPGNGMHPREYTMVLGRKFTKDAAKGTPLVRELYESL